MRLIKTGVLTLITGLALTAPSSVHSSDASASTREASVGPTELTVGSAVQGSLEGDAVHQFSLPLEENQFVFSMADQKSVDVVIKVLTPDGETLTTRDTTARGPEVLQFDSTEKGTYVLEITPFEGATGDYSLTLLRVEPIATEPAARVDQLMAASTGEVPGGVVAVLEGGKVIFQKGYGLANLEHNIPFTVDTITNIGSTSKQFTAFAISLLAERGDLSLDDDVRKHIPELPDFGPTVRIRHLLTHTSGYREYLNGLIMGGRRLDGGDHIERHEVIDLVRHQTELQNEPGAEWNYNNTGYSLLATIVERTTGEEFPEWMTKNVFGPLDMKNTQIRSNRFQVIPGSSQGYNTGSTGFQNVPDIAASMGAGGIYTTLEDLTKWINNLLEPRVGSPAMVEAMLTPFELTDGEETQYGFGLFIDEFEGQPRFHHGGADTAHRSMVMVFPDLDAAVITQSNYASFPGSIADDVARTFFAEHFTTEEDGSTDPDDSSTTEVPGDSTAAESDAPASFDPASFDPESFDRFVGRYEVEAMPGFILTFSRDGESLYTQATGQPQFSIVPLSDSSFELELVEAWVEFHLDEDGKSQSLTLHQNGEHRAVRVEDEAWAPTANDLSAFAGRYFSSEMEAFYTLTVEEDALQLSHRRFEEPRRLEPAAKGLFTAAGPLGTLEFVTDDKGAVTGFTASNGRTRGVLFERVGAGGN